MRKIAKILLGIVMSFVMVINVQAITISTDYDITGTTDMNSKKITNVSTLTINGVQSADTFKAYKILDAFYNSAANTITYEFTTSFKAFLATTDDYKNLTVAQYQALTSGSVTSGSTTTNSTLDTLVSLYATYIKTNAVSGSDFSVSGTNASGTLEAGAWLVLPVTTNKVYAVMVGNIEFKANTAGDGWDITSPTIAAKVSSVSVSKVLKGTTATEGTYSVNEDYSYVITASIPTYPTNATNKTTTIKETLDNGVTVTTISSIIVKDGGTTLTTRADGTVVDVENHTVATITKNGQEITINFNADYVTTNTVTVEYPAKLNTNALTGPEGNKTTTVLTYANDPYGTGTTNTANVVNIVRTYGIKIFKKNSNNEGLSGAVYNIYSDLSLTTNVGTITTGSDGYGISYGLKHGTYYLQEKSAPAGYKVNSDILTVTINTSNNYTETTQVDDKMGLLPSTGGVGTYIFIIIGAFVVVGALVFLYKYLNKNKNGK